MTILLMVAAFVGLACLSPTLTLLSLWQLKEWRIDRLTEHLKREGVFFQLFGKLRPAIAGLWIVLMFLLIAMGTSPSNTAIVIPIFIGLIPVLGLLSCVQIAMQRQPMPVWTMKARLMCGISILIPIVFSRLLAAWSESVLAFIALTSLIPFFCPVWVLASWLLLQPVDAVLKSRIMKKAMALTQSHSKLIVIGITGSVGKTTTKELLAHILKERGAIATPAHVNTEMGVATWLTETLRSKPVDWPGILIVEMGAYKRGEIRLLCNIAQPRYGIITSIGRQHLALFGSTEAIAETKGELFEALPVDGRAFMNGDNEASSPLKTRARCPVTVAGTDVHADLSALNIEETARGIRFTVESTPFEIPIAGTHTVIGVLLAIAVARELGLDMRTIANTLRSFRPLPQTFEVKEIRGVTVLDDTYNASPDSFRAAIEWARSQPHDEKVLLTDGIIELGPYEAEIHEELAAESADIFARAFIGSSHVLPYFRGHGFGDRAAFLSATSRKVRPGGLLVCIGRVQRSAINRLLPEKEPAVRGPDGPSGPERETSKPVNQ